MDREEDWRNAFGGNSYGLYYDEKTKGIFKSEYVVSNNSKTISVNLVLIALMRLVPNEFIPYNNILVFVSLSLGAIFVGIQFGYNFQTARHKNLRRISLTYEQWDCYLKKLNEAYFREIILVLLLIIGMIFSFVLSYNMQSKWWFFGGVGIAFVLGSIIITSLSKTRYMLYKNKITPDLTRGENEDEVITHW